MTGQAIWQAIKGMWNSKPVAFILPVAALGYFWQTHGHKLPSVDEWIAGTVLLATQADKIKSAFFPAPAVQK